MNDMNKSIIEMLFYGSYVQVIRTCGRSSSIEGNISLFDAVCAIVWIGISLMIYYAIIFAMVVRRYINPQLSLLLWVLLVVVTMLYLYFQYIFRNKYIEYLKDVDSNKKRRKYSIIAWILFETSPILILLLYCV